MPVIQSGMRLTPARMVQSVQARVKGVGGTIATAEAVEATLTLPIPADWGGYDVDVTVAVRILETGAAVGATTITLRVRKTNTAGAEWGKTVGVASDTGPTNLQNATFAGYAEGETTTGNITVAFTALAGGNNGLISWSDLAMIAYAWRTS